MSSMELFKGQQRRTWQLRFTDHRGIRRQMSTHQTSRSNALSIAHKVELLLGALVRGDATPGELLQWLHATHVDIREKLQAWEIISGRSAEGGRPLYNPPRPMVLPLGWTDPPPAHVDAWEQELVQREVSGLYSVQSAQRVRVLLSLAVDGHKPLQFLQDLTGEAVMARIRELRRIGPPLAPRAPWARGKGPTRKALSPQTCEHYLAKAREFCAWLVAKGYLPANPLLGLSAYSREVIAANKSRQRRALTREEQATLIQQTPRLVRRWNMEAAERALLYHLALRTGLRANEVCTLRVANFNFFTKTFTVLAEDAKAKRQDTLPLAAELLAPLKTHFEGKHPQAPAFTHLSPKRYCWMLKDDLRDLEIEYQDALGRYADFHALRHTFGTELAYVAMPAEHQRLMRHADISTTMKFYTHVEGQAQAAALAKLPTLTAAPAAKEGAA